MTTDHGHKKFEESVSYALFTFQMIEESLKLYITYSLMLIRVRLDPDIPFGFDGNDYKDAALGTLIKVFSKLSENTELIELLKSVTSQRDYVAHKALVDYIKHRERNDCHSLQAEKITNISVEALKCLVLVQADLAKLDNRINK